MRDFRVVNDDAVGNAAAVLHSHIDVNHCLENQAVILMNHVESLTCIRGDK
jgi:hypothetical protein